jgi:hypothetical protein
MPETNLKIKKKESILKKFFQNGFSHNNLNCFIKSFEVTKRD